MLASTIILYRSFLGFIVVFGCSDCGTQVYEFDTHGLSCHFSKGHYSRHASLNDSVKRSLATSSVCFFLDDVVPGGGTWKRGLSQRYLFLHSIWGVLSLLCTANA